MEWKRFNGSRIETEISEEVERTIIREKQNGHDISICIGTDSQVRGDVVEFATVIVFIRKKKGGFMFVQKDRSNQQMAIKERMIIEVSKSVSIAYRLSKVLDKHKVELEVHADINTDPGFKSNVALKEAMGYIAGMGYSFKAKPDAFASSYCADKVV